MTLSVLNPLVDRLSQPPVPAVQRWARDYDGSYGPKIDLSQAVPGYPPDPRMLEWLAEAAGSVAASGYGEIEGEPVLRAAYAQDVAATYGSAVGPENIHITAGCNQAFVATVMAVAASGDEILLTNPCYFNHETTLSMLGIQTRFVDCHAQNGFLPEPKDIEKALRTGKIRALALVSPNNPTGAVYPPELLREIYEICRAAGVWLVLDETYRDFLAPEVEKAHGLLAVDGWQDGLIQLYSFSKSFCIPGHRLGAITAGPKVITAVAKIMDNLQICAPRAPQMAVAKAIPELAKWRAANRVEISTRAHALRAALAETDGWHLESVGAYFAFVRHPFHGKPSEDVSRELARHRGVVMIPGIYFGKGQDAYLRVAFANASAAEIGKLPSRLVSLPS